MPPAQPSTLFPYTTLFRSAKRSGRLLVHRQPANEPDDQSHEDCAGNRAEDRRGNPAYEHGHVLHDVHSTTLLVAEVARLPAKLIRRNSGEFRYEDSSMSRPRIIEPARHLLKPLRIRRYLPLQRLA